MVHIALLTADQNLAAQVMRSLSFANAHVTQSLSLQDLDVFSHPPDLTVVHAAREPEYIAQEVAHRLNRQQMQAAIAIVPQDQPGWAVQLLNAGVDRYVLESFDEAHLAAVARALLRRRFGRVSSLTHYRSLSFDHERRQLHVSGSPVMLTTREAQVLDVLLRRVGQIVSKEEFVQSIDPDNLDLNSDAIEVYIHRLRKKISSDVLPIRNIKRCGYFLKPDVTFIDEPTHDDQHFA